MNAPQAAHSRHPLPRRPGIALLALAFAAASLLAAGPAWAEHPETLRTLKVNLAADDATSLRIDVPVGEVEVEGTDDAQVVAHVDLNCSRPVKERCRQMARRIQINSGNSNGDLSVELDGWPKNLNNSGLSADVMVAMPRHLALTADLGVGEFEATGLVADLTLDIGVGEASIRALEKSVGRVDLEVGVGDASLRVGERRIEGSGFVGRDLSWGDGPGKAALRVDCGVGEIDVRLED